MPRYSLLSAYISERSKNYFDEIKKPSNIFVKQSNFYQNYEPFLKFCRDFFGLYLFYDRESFSLWAMIFMNQKWNKILFWSTGSGMSFQKFWPQTANSTMTRSTNSIHLGLVFPFELWLEWVITHSSCDVRSSDVTMEEPINQKFIWPQTDCYFGWKLRFN